MFSCHSKKRSTKITQNLSNSFLIGVIQSYEDFFCRISVGAYVALSTQTCFIMKKLERK